MEWQTDNKQYAHSVFISVSEILGWILWPFNYSVIKLYLGSQMNGLPLLLKRNIQKLCMCAHCYSVYFQRADKDQFECSKAARVEKSSKFGYRKSRN